MQGTSLGPRAGQIEIGVEAGKTVVSRGTNKVKTIIRVMSI